MKKILFLLIVINACSLYGQNTAGIYYQGNKIEYSRIGGKKIGNIAGAYFTLGLSSVKSNIVIEGKSASTKIKERNPSFDIYIGSDNITEYIFESPANLRDITLVILRSKKNSRNIRTGKYGLTGVSIGLDENDIQPILIEKITENHYKVAPKEDLNKGEYAFYYLGKAPEGKIEFNGVFDFKIE